MKPKLGRKVYCIYDNTILGETVYAIGKNSFFISNVYEGTYSDSWEWEFNEYGTTWFTSLTEAKKVLLETAYNPNNEKLKIVKKRDDFWEVEYC